jgi:hypothetical protein
MKWTYIIKQKLTAAILLTIVLGSVLLKNIIDSRNVSQLADSFSSVYEDRLVVEGYIYKLSAHLYQKKLIMDNCLRVGDRDVQHKIAAHHTAIAALITEYERTKLTDQESVFFTEFKNNITALQALEEQHLNDLATASIPHILNEKFIDAAANLHQLSLIQLTEGKALRENSKRIAAGSSMLTHIELVILIGIAAIIQMLIFASDSIRSKFFQRPELN